MAEYKIQGETLTAIADALRAKTGATAKLTPEQMAVEIEGIVTGDDLPDAEDVFFGSAAPEYGMSTDLSNASTNSDNGTGFHGFLISGEDVVVTGLRGVTSEGKTMTLGLWDYDTKTKLASLYAPGQGVDTWVEAYFDTPITLQAGKQYALSYKGGGYSTGTINIVTIPTEQAGFDNRLTWIGTNFTTNTTCPTLGLIFSWVYGVDIIIANTETAVTEYKIQTETMDNLADAIREKAGVEQTISPAQMIAIVGSVNLNLQEKTVTPSSEVQEIVPDDGYYGLSKVTVNAAESGGGSAQPFGYATNHMSFPRLNVTTTATGITV